MPPQRPMEKWERIRTVYMETKSIRKTAQCVSLSKTGVEYALRAMKVSLFPRNRSGDENSSRKAIRDGSPSALVRNESLMFGLYHVEGLSIPEIARATGASRTTVITGLVQCHIETRSISMALRGKPRPSMCGARNPAWKGGSTHWRRLARHQLNTVWVYPVMKRDGFKCQTCGSRKDIEAHHVRRFHQIVAIVKARVGDADQQTLVNAIIAEHSLDDGLTLCMKCHDELHEREP
jgi:hypothetical protein